MVWMRKRQTAQGESISVQWRQDGRIQSVTFSGEERVEAERFKSLVHAHGDTWPPGYREAHYGGARTNRTIRGQILHYIEVHPSGQKGWKGESRRITDRYFPETDALGAMPVSKVTHSDVLAWVQRMNERSLSAKTIRNAHALLSGALGLAMRDGDIDANPSSGAAPRSGDPVAGSALTQQEFATVVSLMVEPYRLLVLTLGRTGMRWGEATAVTWADLHLSEHPPYIHVTRAWKETEERGKFEIGAPKTRRGVRRIYIDEELATQLKAHRPEDAKPNDYVFVTEYGNPIRGSNFTHRHWRPKIKAAYANNLISFKPRVHDLRHSHATWLLEDGQPVTRVAARLGHDPAVLMRTYSHLMDRGAAETAQAVETMFSGVEPLPTPENFEFETPSQRKGKPKEPEEE